MQCRFRHCSVLPLDGRKRCPDDGELACAMHTHTHTPAQIRVCVQQVFGGKFMSRRLQNTDILVCKRSTYNTH